MNEILIFIWILLGFISMAFWEAYIEGKHPWAGEQVGWKKCITKRVTLTAYHFWVSVMFFFFLSLPLLVYGWDIRLLGIIISGAALGITLEDFLWFLVNPCFSIKRFNSKEVYWYPWLKIGRINIPLLYIFGILVSFFSWYFLWK